MTAKDQFIICSLEGFDPIVGYALACLETERERTRVAVTGLSIEALDAEVDGSPNSIGSLLYHIAGIELDWLYAEILERDIPESYAALFPVEVRDREGHLSAVMGVSASEYLQRLETVRADVLTQLKPMTTEEFYRVRQLPPYDVNPAWVLYHLLEHEAKHAEQIARIRRALKGNA
ncbi:MAG: DinB family protein [Pleurocapsa sp. SU_196_0]|nr:DinB family protein [Pleurocapsa sp. SU_196_0]